jgi:hypothetical protein
MLNRSILAELAVLEARFKAGCVVCIDLIDSYDNVAGHFYCLIRVCGSLYVWYVFLDIVAGNGFGGSVRL